MKKNKVTAKDTADLILKKIEEGGYSREGLNHLEHITGQNGRVLSLEDLDPEVRMLMSKKNPEVLVAFANSGDARHEAVHKYKTPAKRGNVTLSITRKLTLGEAVLTDDDGNEVNLPAPIFGALEIASDYTRVVNAFLPEDGSVQLKSFARTADGQGLIFTYKNTADTINETVTIRAKNKGAVYTNLLQALTSAAFQVVGPSLIISDATQKAQFGQSIGTFYGSMFTKNVDDSVNPDEQKKEYLSDETIRILKNTFEITPEDTLVLSIIPEVLVSTEGSFVGSDFTLDVVCPIENIVRFANL